LEFDDADAGSKGGLKREEKEEQLEGWRGYGIVDVSICACEGGKG